MDGITTSNTQGLTKLLSISAFARRVGLAPSALRFYDDCRVLEPARVDEATGYRYYNPDQEIRARMLRSLREAGMPLADVTVVLDGDAEEARAVLERHRGTVRDRSRTADATIAAALRSLTGAATADGAAEPPTRVRIGGAELASAVRQVVPAVARDPELPVLGCVLVEIDADEVRLVATDRYRLSVRVLRPVTTVAGPPRKLLVEAAALTETGTWAARHAAVTIEAGPDGARIHGAQTPAAGAGSQAAAWAHGGLGAMVEDDVRADARTADGTGAAADDASDDASRELPLCADEFPAYREMLAALSPARHRLLVDRTALLDAVEGLGDARAVEIRLAEDKATVSRADGPDGADGSDDSSDSGGSSGSRDSDGSVGSVGSGAVTLAAVCLGAPALRIRFDPSVLAPALDAGVGPDVLLEIASAAEPVVVRSADQGSFTTLVMPVGPADEES
ncbi:MerR family transcriptional regulator [Streptomyces sp. NPDC095613]|uniref:DNA polymerase III subunit beta family protein n=1 Tax=Streptomyces sp. NPDC095613 TaxID=3155540 RepID=UPI003327E513